MSPQSFAHQACARLSSREREQIELYLNLLQSWNQVHNLSGARRAEDLKLKHLLEPLALQAFLGPEPLYYVGAGAGALGIVTALLQPRLRVSLIEKSAKKAAFLRQCQAELQLTNLEVRASSASESPPPTGNYQLLTRAFANLADSPTRLGPWLSSQARWLALKGPSYERELLELPPDLQLRGCHALYAGSGSVVLDITLRKL